MAVLRFDVGRLDRAQRTGAGGARVPATIARTGVQVYKDQFGNTVREYRPPETVFAADSLATLGSIPVTVGHPRNGVTARNHREVSVGHVSDAPPGKRSDGAGNTAVHWLETAVVVSDADTLAAVESGKLTEVSMGYMADVVPESGVTPGGEKYDAVQRNIRFNHLALLGDGHARAGSGARLRLDGNQEPTMYRADDNTSVAATPKARVKVDGIECESGSDTHVQMLERARDSEKKRADDAAAALATAQTTAGESKAKLDAAEAKLAGLDVNKLVQDELDFRQSVLPVLPKGTDGKPYDFTGKSRDAVRADAVGAAVMAEAAKLDSDAARSGYVAAHLKMKLDAVGKGTAPLHVPSKAADKTDSTEKPKPKDRRADAYASSWGSK